MGFGLGKGDFPATSGGGAISPRVLANPCHTRL
jgi:hypothetical protein